jgi:CRISPR-associated protein Csm5
MNPYQSYRLHITPLSPVHIGTGQSYEPTNYVIDDGILHEFDTGSVIDAFSAKDREGLLAIANRKPNADMIKALQQYFHERQERLKPWAVNRIPVLQGVASLYAKNIGKTAQREADGGEVLNRLEIDRCAYDPITRKPVLFGSSMKGAIRTALLDRVNERRSAHEHKGLHEFQGRLFKYRDPDRGKLKLELDPMRLVQLADASLRLEQNLPMAQVHLAVNRKKQAIVDSSGQLRKAMGDNLYQILECVPGWRYRAFSGQINLQRVGSLKQQQDLPHQPYQWTIEAIASACNDFYWSVFTSEVKQMSARQFLDKTWGQSALQLHALVKDKVKRGEAFLLRVGRHSGAESVTVPVARNGKIKIKKGKEQQPDYADAAKTLWLAADTKDQQTGLLPFGWLLVEVQPIDAPEQEWPELQALCEPHLVQARAFASRVHQQREKLEQARAQAESARQAEQEQARIKAEQDAQAAREEAERQARLAAMSENALAVENLKNRMTPGNKGRRQSDRLYQEVNQLIKAASAWSVEDQQALRTGAIAIFEHLGLKRDDYKKLIRDLAP